MQNKRIKGKLIRNILIVICIFTTLGSAGTIGTFYFKHNKLLKAISLQKRRIEKLQKDLRNSERLLLHYQQEISRFRKLLFTDRDVATFLEEMSTMAKKSKVRIVDITTYNIRRVLPEEREIEKLQRRGRKSKKKTSQKMPMLSLAMLPMKVKIKSEFKNIVKFLLYLEKYRQLLTLSDVKISLSRYPLLDSQFNLRLYSIRSIKEIEEKE